MAIRLNQPEPLPCLRRGDEHPSLHMLRAQLAVKGFGGQTVTGNGQEVYIPTWDYDKEGGGSVGPVTESAVKAFQSSVGLEPTGQVGAATWLALSLGGSAGFAECKKRAPDWAAIGGASALVAASVLALYFLIKKN